MCEEPQGLTFLKVLVHGAALVNQDEKAAWENGCHKLSWMERIYFSKTVYSGGSRNGL